MPLKRPLIGITPDYEYEGEKICLNSNYAEAVNAAGGFAMILPLIEDFEIVTQMAETLDGLLLSGGPDIDAMHFYEENMPYTGRISPLRDTMEISLAKEVFRLNKPIFGICRGVQVLNVAMGGTLYQDISSQVKSEKVLKHSQAAPRWYPTHDIRIVGNSNVWSSFNCDSVRVNSFHHQAIRDVAPGFKATSHASDGIIESIEFEGDAFVVGVQWHPECMWKKNPIHLRVFELFVEAATVCPLTLRR